MIQKGREELTGPRALGNYFTETKNGRVVLLRGKFKGAFLDTIPAGYIGRFLLRKCCDSMTPKEIALCKQYAGDSMIKKIRRKVKMTPKDKIQVHVEAGKGIAEAFDKAAKHGCSEISLTIPVPKNKNPTVLDQLRTRGTPLELIESYLLTDNKKAAQQAFRSSVLEHVYERLAEAYNATCWFDDASQCKIQDDTHQLVRPLRSTPEGEKRYAPVIEVHLENCVNLISDSPQATILATIERLGTDVIQNVALPLAQQHAKPGREEGAITFGIFPAISHIELKFDPANDRTGIHTSGSIALYVDVQPTDDKWFAIP